MEEQKLRLADVVRAAEQRTHLLYEGDKVAHRSCGISLAETFGRETKPYQSLRRGGITGDGQCGAIKAGEIILGEIYGDPDPRGGVTDSLKKAIQRYQDLWKKRVDKGDSESIICNDLTGQFNDFYSEPRHQFCTNIASTVSGCIAQVMVEMGSKVELPPEPTE